MLPNPNPLARIFNTLLLYALRDGARAIRLESGQVTRRREIRMSEIRMIETRSNEARTIGFDQRETGVEFLIGAEWRPQLQIPDYVFAPLVAHIEAMQDASGAIQLRFVETDLGLGLDLPLHCEKSVTEYGEGKRGNRLEISLGRFNFEGNYDSKTG